MPLQAVPFSDALRAFPGAAARATGKTRARGCRPPDGERIVFNGCQNRSFWQVPDGSGSVKELTSGKLSPNNVPGSGSPDARRFLKLKTAAQTQAPDQIYVVLNWFEELMRRVPTGAALHSNDVLSIHLAAITSKHKKTLAGLCANTFLKFFEAEEGLPKEDSVF